MNNNTFKAFLFAIPTSFALSSKSVNAINNHECKSAQEEAEELAQIMQKENGGLPLDPMEMREELAKAEQGKKLKPPQFARITMPLKMFTMATFRPPTGFTFGFGVPFHQRFQASMNWNFSNTKPSAFELMAMLTGEGNPMDEDSMNFVQVQTSSQGRLAIMGQQPLPGGAMASLEMEMPNGNPQMAMQGFGIQKNFSDFHFQYQFQQVHLFHYMQHFTKNLVYGVQMGYVPQNGRSFWSYAATYQLTDKTQFLAQYSPMTPEKVLIGVVSRPGKRLNLFSQFVVNEKNKTETVMGFRSRFAQGNITGTISSTGRATSVFKHYMDMFEISLTSTMDFSKPQQPVTFGMGVQLGGGM